MLSRVPFCALRLIPLALALALAPGCDGADSWMPPHTGRDAASPSVDAGTMVSTDGGSRSDAAPGSRSEFNPDDGLAEATASCFNGVDDDGDGLSDCEDRSCRTNVPACCVGVSDPLCCTASDAVVVPLGGCEGDVTGCEALTALTEPFGAPGPRVQRWEDIPAFVPGGATSDSGLLLRKALDARTETITLEATIVGSRGARDAADFVALGLVDAERASELTQVTPAVALMVSANRGEVSLALAGEVVLRWPWMEGLPSTYALSVQPDGAIELRREGERLGRATLRLERPLRAVLYGRSTNLGPTDPPPVRVLALSLRAAACDAPSALDAIREPVLPATGESGWEDVRRVGAPSIARWTNAEGLPEERMAVEIDGAIFLARRDASGTPSGWALTSAFDAPALASPHGAIGDPALVWDGERLGLWFSTEEGAVGWVRALEGEERFAWDEVELRFTPARARFSDPAPYSHAGLDFLALRVDEAGKSRIAVYRQDGTHIDDVREQGTDLFAFDRDEVGAPAVVTTADGVVRMYFAGRRGSRFSIGVLVSPDGVLWREPSDGAQVLSASGIGFDALGVHDPAPVLEGEELHLYYTGLDGTHARVGLARGPAPLAR